MSELPLVHLSRPAESGTSPFPALILLHGLGSNEADLFSLASQIDCRLTVFSVRAPHDYDYGGYMWWDIERETPGLGGPLITASLAALGKFLEAAGAAYHLDAKHIYLGGFSQGAAMAGAFSLLHPDRVAGTIMLSGFLPPDPDNRYHTEEATGHPIFQGHGVHDQVISIDFARMTRDFLAQTPVILTYREYPIGHEVSLPELQDIANWVNGVLTEA
ncbi:MAG: phospholipase [Chloroflexota bacterium]|nr:phospholipase [Chloroflexota bacterium]